jgi:hypothetical protein
MALTVILPSGLSNTGNFSVGSVNATGNVTGAYFLGNGACLSGVITSVANINNGTSNVTVVSSGGNVTVGVGGTSNVAVFATTGEYVTGLLSVSGNITSGNVSAVGNINVGGNLVVTGNITDVTQIDITTSAGNANIVLTPNGTGNVNTPANVSVTGNVTANNGMFTNIVNVASHTGAVVSVSGNITGGNVITGGKVGIGTSSPSANLEVAGAAGQNIYVTYTAGSQLRLKSDTGDSGIGTTGATPLLFLISNAEKARFDTAGNLSVVGSIIVNSAGNATAIVNGAANAVGNIGSSGTYFNRLFAQATTALYADLAEMYTTDAEYKPGTVLIFGGNQEVTMSTVTHDTRVAGVVSTNPAHVMNSGLQAEHTVAVALTGRVPVSVIGNITAGDRVVSSNRAGVAEALDMSRYQPGVIIGKALQSYSGDDVGVIEVVVGRL